MGKGANSADDGEPPASAVLADEACIEWVRQRLTAIAPSLEDVWSAGAHLGAVSEFLTSHTSGRLFAYVDAGSGELRLQTTVPPAWEKLLYMVRDASKFITADNIDANVHYGLVNGSTMDNMLQMMAGVYVPAVIGNRTWPDSVRKEFMGQLHKFMANLTEAAFEAKGKTVLYIPQEELGKPEAAASEKDLVQRLESTLIHWTRQIKEVILNQDNSEIGEDAGPLAEIEFWRSRSVDLSGIRAQLDEPGVARIVGVLELAKSSYLPPFLNLSNLIQHEAAAAEDNLKFVSSLEAPCKMLSSAEPAGIPPLLPKLLHCIRMIWNISRFYNTPERLTGLLRKVSNEIINRCSASISLSDIFDGDVESVMGALRQSILAGEAWKRAYRSTTTAIARAGERAWDFDVSSIFAQIDAFVQRCRDMLEVCEAQTQFAPRTKLPAFGGARGPEISKSLVDIQTSFHRLVVSLRSLEYNILDVKATRWHDDYNSFKSGVKDLEVMMQRVIMLAFESVSDLSAKVELLEAFQAMAKRESIKRAVEKKTAEVYAAFTTELNATRKHFDSFRRAPPVDPAFPRYAGAALWALSLQRRIDKPMARLEMAAPFLPQTGEAEELRQVYEGLSSAIESFIKDQNHLQWFNSLDASLSQKLDNTLIVMGDDGLLRVNFDQQVLSLFAEVHYWERLNLDIPYVAMEISSQREKFRVLRENVKLVVRDYNRIITSLDAGERKLFADRIHYLDRRVAPGIHKLQWTASKHTLEYYVREARKYAGEAYLIVTEWKAANARIAANARLISETSLVSIEKKRMYEDGEFEERQREHREMARERFSKAYNEIHATLSAMYETFAQDSDDVQAEWAAYTRRVDKLIEEALRATVKRSLQELSRALNGDAKTEVTPIFNVSVVLDQSRRVELKPSVQDLFNMIHNVSREVLSVLKVVPRIAEPPAARAAPGTGEGEGGEQAATAAAQARAALPSFFDIVSNDEEVALKTIVSITTGVSSIVEKVQQYTVYWSSKYKHIWDNDKEAYIRRYQKAKKNLASFDSDVCKYKDLQDEVQGEDTSTNMRFLRLDCAPLKQSLVAHCEEWCGKFLDLLNTIAADELRAIHSHFQRNTEELRRPAANLEMLADNVALLKRMIADTPDMEARFEPLEEKYNTLEKFDHAVSEEEQALREGLAPAWTAFRAMLQETEKDLERAKEQFREQLQKMVGQFVRQVAEQRELFQAEAPFSAEGVTHADAVEYTEQAREEMAANRKKEAELAKGLEIFGMSQPPYKEMDATEKELGLLEGVWALVAEWARMFDGWKDGKFRELQVQSMEEEAVRFNKKVAKIGREIRSWPVWQHIRATVDSFKSTMPLITDLRNPAMRARHWEQLMELIGEKFDPAGDEFTLGRVSELHLENFVDKIGELSSNATKELQIEISLQKIDEKWAANDLDIVPFKEGAAGMYKLRSTEDIFNDLEENIVMLSTMKSSRFFLVFETDILKWEQGLSLVSEMVEIVLQVQRSYMYLENIFVGSEDIRKQLPAESNMFDTVDATFKRSMKAMYEAKNALKATHLPKMLDTFQEMDAKLEKIQKSLDAYLEKKRQQFPRFYFLSSDDLLEILGQAKDPMNVQPHFKKCFEGIKRLDMHPPGSEGRRHFEASAMQSPDGEKLPFASAVQTEGRPEEWLNKVEATMYATTKRFLLRTLEESKGMKKERWVKEFPGQCIITAGQILWTADCERALSDAESARSALKLLKKKWVAYLNRLVSVTRSKLNKIERKKVVALITIEVHARDVIEKLVKTGCSGTAAFEWVSQLRFYWDRDVSECMVRQVLSVFTWGGEYQGNNGRLVITPLTDRCYMTLGAAMFTRRGGNPLGPAGTGKTETVKDFGKALARYVIVFNCSDGVDYKMTAKMFSGLAQTGAWTCLDEFNRIEVEVLSVVATQISVVMNAIKAGKTRFVFEGQDIRLISSCGIFVTMNPGYAGRSELPDNLKALVRPVSMMVPDFTLIAEIMLFSEGFQSAKALSKKMISIMELSQQQLSKQDHYDYGLRSFVIPIARAAGALKRADPDTSEDFIMYRTMLDLIKPKLVYADLPLFQALLSDLFPGLELNDAGSAELRAELEKQVREAGLIVVDEWITKMVQIFDCKVARHGNMIVGRTGAGKSEAWKCLTRAMAELKKRGAQGEYERVTVHTINPLALSNDELYGSFDAATHEWTDGVLAKLMRNICRDEGLDQKWVLFDGPVDTLWIESMNTLLDDNKLLTLLSGERISMPAQVSLLFEVEDLSVASPATVSRAGMIYMNTEDLGWMPFVTSWLQRKQDTQLVEVLRRMVDKYVGATLEFKRLNCREEVPVDQLSSVRYTCMLFDALATAENGCDPSEGDARVPLLEMWFLYSLIWAMGGTVDEAGRKAFDMHLRELDARYPSQDTVFEYFVDPKKKAWVPWEEKLGQTYRPAPDTPFFKMVVPTVDTLRTRAVLETLVGSGRHALLTGNVGVGKTLVIEGMLEALPSGKSSMVINFSAQTGSKSLQETIEGNLEKRTKGVFAPVGGKKLVTFVDDMNMPAKSVFGFMPPLELLKLWMDNGFWYDRAKQEVKHVKDMQLLGAMAPPGGGRNAFSQRILSCFGVVNMTAPSDAQVLRIFSALLNSKLSDFDDEIKPLGDPIAAATTEVYNAALEHLLPTPSKCTYLFNLRDVGKIVQGVLQASARYFDSRESLLQLWCHESCRVLQDRMWSAEDKSWLEAQIDKRLQEDMGSGWNQLFDRETGVPPFVSFVRQVDNPPYEAVNDMGALKDLLTEKLEDYNLEPGTSAMDLVLFRDAMHHLCRIHRVLCLPRGNALLVGVGGSGRKSMARLASYVAELKVFSIEITKNYRLQEFYEDLKMLFKQAGASNKPTVFLFDDQQIVAETFLEAINNILTSGMVPNIFPKDELPPVLDECRADAKKVGMGDTADQVYKFFLDRVRNNLHVVLCLSPIGEAFRERVRMFPGLVNCTTIDWFTEWPSDALYEVASKLLEEENLGGDEVKSNICRVFVTAHTSVSEASDKMLQSLKRHNYVTPTNYLETLNTYRLLLKEKRASVGEQAQKLSGGLEKLGETSVQVGEMQVVCEDKKVVVAKAKKDCEELLVEIVQEKRVVDEQERQVNAEADKISKEAAETQVIADDCQRDLDKAMPALNAAVEALNVLTKKDLSEVKAYAKPPPAVEMTLSAVLTVLKKPVGWDEAKKQLNDSAFLTKLMEYDKDLLNDSLLKKIGKFTNQADFTPDSVGKVSGACRGLALWVHAMDTYGHVARDVAPKRAKLKSATDTLNKKQKALKKAKGMLAEVQAKVQALKDKYEQSTASKEALQREAEDLELKLQRAEKLVNGLAGERGRWEASIGVLDEQLKKLPGDVMMAAAFMSYAGPFPASYREELVDLTWMKQLAQLAVPSSPKFDFASFLADPSDVRDWNIQGLPADTFSTENGVMVKRGRRWPLMIDPQGQANKWIRNMEEANGLKIIDLQMPGYIRTVENCVQFGTPVLLQNILEDIDPILEPLLAKAFIKKGNQVLIKVGDKEIDFSPDFKLYITTKLSNPHYQPEISTKAMIANFALSEPGLEAQLLNTVVKKERPDLDQQKGELVVKVAAGKRKQAELEDTILYMLSTATGSLLDNVELINTLDNSKVTWEEVNESLKVSEETSAMIDEASSAYQPCALRAAALYFVLSDLAMVDPMYQFSLDAYQELFLNSIAKSTKSDTIAERIKNLNDFHTYAVYKYTSRGLFEKHKLLLSMQLCVKILRTANAVNMTEWTYLLRGGFVVDKAAQPANPNPAWISEEMWDNISMLEELLNFKGVVASFEQSCAVWEEWYREGEPELAELPGEWEAKCNELQRIVFVRCLRPDRVIFAATSYVANNLGRKFVEPPVLDLAEVYVDSSPVTPLIFVLSPGVDPTSNLQQLAAQRGQKDLVAIALGQGQAPHATRAIEAAVQSGGWVFLANCHLMTSWLPTLEKIIEDLPNKSPHADFRLWLSSNPTPDFPINILQGAVKLTTEPPRGLRANLLRMYSTVTEESYGECRTAHKYSKLLFCLAYFHSVLLERRKFQTLGLNIPYDFNDTDFAVSDDLLKTYLDEYEEVPWDALKYLISEANYGGRVTDELDRRVLNSYLHQFYCEDALNVPNYPLSTMTQYFVPEHGTLQSFRDYAVTLPTVDQAEAFGQHPNADISYMIHDSKTILESLVSLLPAASSSGGATTDDLVTTVLDELMSTVPHEWNLENVQKAKADDPSALHVVLFQEVERYNVLLKKLHATCEATKKGIKGLVVMSAELDDIFNAVAAGRVPDAWKKTYPSVKPLGSWMRDLVQRVDELNAWISGTYPKVYWLSGYTYPTGFLTAVLQTTARRNTIPIDTLSWDFSIINLDESEITQQPKEGVYVKGIFLEGAGWDYENACLTEPEPQELIVSMPIIHFKPVEGKKKSARGLYSSPLYLYPVRTGSRERPSFMITVDLKAGVHDSDLWVKRGTALLLSLSA